MNDATKVVIFSVFSLFLRFFCRRIPQRGDNIINFEILFFSLTFVRL